MVLLRKMALEVAAVVKNAGHFDHAIAAATIEKKMTRVLHTRAAHSVPAKFQMVGPCAPDHHFRALFGSWTLGIGSDVL